MILQSLYAYYERLKKQGVRIAPEGYAPQKISFCLILKPDGSVAEVQDLRQPDAKGKLKPIIMQLPSIERANGLNPQFLWDNTQYTLGRVAEEGKKAERALLAFDAFKELHHKNLAECNSPTIQAFARFLETWNPSQADSFPLWAEMAGQNVVFRLAGMEEYLHDAESANKVWRRLNGEVDDAKSITGICLLSGEEATIARLHPAIKGVDGSNAKGGSLVSFNATAFESYGHSQSYNAPVAESAAFAYATALSYLLRRDPGNRHRLKIGDTTSAFWAEKDSPVENCFASLIEGFEPGASAEATEETERLRHFIDAARKGHFPGELAFDEDVRFYILGLSPNNARLAVRFWHVCTTGAIARRLGQHFEDLSMEHGARDHEYPGMWELLKETARETKDISPVLGGEVARAIFEGTRYPLSLLMGIINRIRADQRITYLRAAIIKAILNRSARLSGKKEEMKMSLDEKNREPAYVLGRLFALLEKAQQDAIPGANSTIKDRFYGSASATPGSVFPRLLRLAQHHIEKAEYGYATDRRIAEVMELVDNFPAHLDLEGQGRFAIGYYHQRNALFRKKEEVAEPAASVVEA
jgi:CRISPR-associated protein Csd1